MKNVYDFFMQCCKSLYVLSEKQKHTSRKFYFNQVFKIILARYNFELYNIQTDYKSHECINLYSLPPFTIGVFPNKYLACPKQEILFDGQTKKSIYLLANCAQRVAKHLFRCRNPGNHKSFYYFVQKAIGKCRYRGRK